MSAGKYIRMLKGLESDHPKQHNPISQTCKLLYLNKQYSVQKWPVYRKSRTVADLSLNGLHYNKNSKKLAKTSQLLWQTAAG